MQKRDVGATERAHRGQGESADDEGDRHWVGFTVSLSNESTGRLPRSVVSSLSSSYCCGRTTRGMRGLVSSDTGVIALPTR